MKRKIVWLQNKNIIFISLVLIFIFTNFFGFILFNKQSKNAFAETQIATTGDVVNNLVLVNFKGETANYNLYNNSYTTFNTLYNTGNGSLNEYFKANSNGALNLVTDIITADQQEATIFTLEKERTYYLPYKMLVKNSNGQKTLQDNENGYFDYYLIDYGGESLDATDPTFYSSNTLISRVYSVPDGYTSYDDDMSDKIISYDAALQLVNARPSFRIVETAERFFREYMMHCDIVEKASEKINDQNSDTNNDGYLDNFSIGVVEDTSVAKYASEDSFYMDDLLWPHAVEIPSFEEYIPYIKALDINVIASNMEKFEYNRSDVLTLFHRMEFQPKTTNGKTFKTISLTNHKLYDLGTEEKWNNFTQNISTIAQKQGVMLGLSDLYEDSTTENALVGSWTHMGNYNVEHPSFFSAYEREKLGWLNTTNNIKTITQTGVYNLKAVKGYDQTNTVAYKIQNPNDANSFIYFEYRNVEQLTYDSGAGLESGLLIYSVSKPVEGQTADVPHEIYVHRKSTDQIEYAVFDDGESFGNNTIEQLTNAITFNAGSSKEANSGLVISVLRRTDGELYFRIEGSILGAESNYTIRDFGNNRAVYNKLLSQASGSFLNYNSLSHVTALDLSDCEIDDMWFITYLFDLSSVRTINLINNNLSQEANFDKFVQKYSLTKLFLSDNTIDLSKISNTLLLNAAVEWGVQYTAKKEVLLGRSIELMYYYSSSTTINSITVNGTQLSRCLSGGYKTYSQSEKGNYTIVTTYGMNDFSLTTLTKTVMLADIYTNYNSEETAFRLGINQSFPTITELILFSGIEYSEVELSYSYPQTNVRDEGYFTVGVTYEGSKVSDINIYYVIFETTIVYNGGQTIVLQTNEQYVEKGIKVLENDVDQNYTYSEDGENSTYNIKYYLGTLNSDGSANITDEVTSIDTSKDGKYIVNYIVTNSSGQIFYKYYNAEIIVDDEMIKVELVDETLYDVLLGITGDKYLFVNDFITYDLLDLSNSNLTSIKGLELFDLKQDLIIDLSNNNLSNTTELSSFISQKNEVKALILVFNKFPKTDVNVLQNRNKFVFAIQNLSQKNLIGSVDAAVADLYDDYSSYLTINCDGMTHDSASNSMKMTTYGKITCEVTALYNDYSVYSKDITTVLITQKSNSITKEYSDEFEFNISSLFEIQGSTFTKLEYISNYSTLNLTTIGNKSLDVTFTYLDSNLTHSQTIVVVDTKNPTITITGNDIIYISNPNQYQTQASSGYEALDEYDDNNNILVEVRLSNPTFSNYGIYDIVYTATDSSGNSATASRKVHYGNVALAKTSSIEENGVAFSIPFNVQTFSIEDFNISYKTPQDSFYNTYNAQNGITISSYGKFDVRLRLVHNQNSNIAYNFTYKVDIEDTENPVLTLLGESFVRVFAGEQYVEPGYSATDNSTEDVVTPETTSQNLLVSITITYAPKGSNEYTTVTEVDGNNIGTYKITYTVSDLFSNIDIKERTVLVDYAPIESIYIDQSKMLPKYSAGQEITFNVINNGEHLTPPDVVVVWYMNGNEIKRTTTLSTTIKFDEAGEFVITAEILGSDGVVSQHVNIEIYEKSQYENVILYAGIALAVVTILAFVIFLLRRYKKRNFY